MFPFTTSLALAFCIFVWLKTNAFSDFFSWLLPYGNFLYIKDYNAEPIALKDNLRYPLWLYTNHRCFMTKLLSCPLCLSFWTNLICVDTLEGKLSGAIVTLFTFSVMDNLYKHGK